MNLNNKIPLCNHKEVAIQLYNRIQLVYLDSGDIDDTVKVCDFDETCHVEHTGNISVEIVKYINLNMKLKYSLCFQHKNIDFTINIFKMDYESIDDFLLLVKIAIVTSLLETSPFEEKTTSNIDIFLTALPKFLSNNRKNKSIGVNNINSSFSCFDECIYISVYREEEWFKCLIYELFLSFTVKLITDGIDFNNIISMTLFENKADFSMTEPIIEFLARLYNVAILTFKTEKTLRNYITSFRDNLEEERIFSIIQSNKILSHFDMKYSSVLNTNSPSSQSLYRETTNAFGFYVITSILFYDFDRVVKWLNFKDKPFCIYKSEREIVIFTHYISCIATNKTMVELYDNLDYIDSDEKNINMSAFEI